MFFGVDGCIDCQNAKRGNVFCIPTYISRYIHQDIRAGTCPRTSPINVMYIQEERHSIFHGTPFLRERKRLLNFLLCYHFSCALFGTFKVDVGNFFAFRMLTHWEDWLAKLLLFWQLRVKLAKLNSVRNAACWITQISSVNTQ